MKMTIIDSIAIHTKLYLFVTCLWKWFCRLTFGFIVTEKKLLEKPWWKRREYKIPEEHFQVYKRPRKIDVKKYQKKVRYHNSSQFRHWILGGTILIAFITLGTKLDNSSFSRYYQWTGSKGNVGQCLESFFQEFFVTRQMKIMLPRLLCRLEWSC